MGMDGTQNTEIGGPAQEPDAKRTLHMEDGQLRASILKHLAEKPAGTNKLNGQKFKDIALGTWFPFARDAGHAKEYRVMPNPSAGGADCPRWRIELHSTKSNLPPLGLE